MTLGRIVYSSTYRGLSYANALSKRFLYLNGQTVSRSSFLDLSPYFPVGTYGSDSLNIVLPDLTNVYWRGLDLDRGLDFDKASRTTPSGTLPTGDNLGTFQTASMPAHVHISGTPNNTGPTIARIPGNPATFFNTINTVSLDSSNTLLLPNEEAHTLVSGTSNESFDVGALSYFPYIGADV